MMSMVNMMKKLASSFFNRPTLTVAQELLGKILIFKNFKGMITETEAYFGFDDPASHAAKGLTPRNQIMFKKAGFAYVYLIYGMYHCLNVVTEKKGFAAAVLIRGIQLLNASQLLLDGPGKLCKHLGITKTENGLDTTKSQKLYFACMNQTLPFNTTPRIGIRQGQDKMWRFLANLS